MSETFAALLFRPDEVSDEALSLGVAMALAGYALDRPRLDVAPLDAAPGWSAAFYRSGQSGRGHTPEDELEHAEEVFSDDELPPGLAVHAAALALGAPRAVVYALLHAPEADLDEAWRFGGEDSPDEPAHRAEASPDEGDEGDEDERSADEGGLGLVSRELGAPMRGALVKAFHMADASLVPRLAPAAPAGIEATTRDLLRTLGRTEGRGAFAPGPAWGAAPPAPYGAFVKTYDWADPRDPSDLYRGVALGGVVGTVRWLRPASFASLGPAPSAGLYPIAELLSSHLTDPKRTALLALDARGERVLTVDPRGRSAVAGPTLGELLRYLALGLRARTPFEEELIQCLQLRAACMAP